MRFPPWGSPPATTAELHGSPQRTNPYFFGVLVGDSDRKSNVNLIIPEDGDSETVDHFFPTKVDPSKLNLFSPFQVYT